MAETHPILLATLAGFAFGNAFCWLPGPINLTILNEGARRGFLWAIMIGMGAVVMDGIYCGIAFAGFSQFFDHGMVKASMQLGSFVFLLLLGFKFLMSKSVNIHTKLDDASEKLEVKIEEKFHPHSAFMTGFVRVGANLGVLAAWLVMAATMMSNDWVDETAAAKSAAVGGVLAGASLWFLFLSYAISRGHGKFSEKNLLRLQHASGLCLIIAGLFEGVQMAWHLSQNKF